MGLALQSRVGGPYWIVFHAKRQNHYIVHTPDLKPQPRTFWKLPVWAPWIVTANVLSKTQQVWLLVTHFEQCENNPVGTVSECPTASDKLF